MAWNGRVGSGEVNWIAKHLGSEIVNWHLATCSTFNVVQSPWLTGRHFCSHHFEYCASSSIRSRPSLRPRLHTTLLGEGRFTSTFGVFGQNLLALIRESTSPTN